MQAQSPAPRLITQPINSTALTTLVGNTRPEANAANDRGVVPDSLALNHMLLQLRRSDVQEKAFETLIDQLHDRGSPNFHKWLSIGAIGALFGPATADIQTVTGWLAQNGFTVNHVYTNGMVIDFSGTAGQVRTAFHTEIHHLSVKGVAHIANMSDLKIPTALAPAVVGIVSLHDFRAQPLMTITPAGATTTQYDVGPADLATIYNFNPVFNSGNHGQNQTIYLIETADMPVTNDWYMARWVFGIPSYPTASLSTIHPPLQPGSTSNNCIDPATIVQTDPVSPVEATLDAEYASAAAPGAAIVLVACANAPSTSGSMAPTEGHFIGILNLINGPYAPSIVSLSFGESETSLGAAKNAALSSAYQTAVGLGYSVFVSAGDAGAAESDRTQDGVLAAIAIHGINVNGHASTPYNVAVGGTDFGDAYLGATSSYWTSTNVTALRSAKSYIPEIPWNATCGSALFAKFNGYSISYGSSGFCNSSYVVSANPAYLEPRAGGGGPSACAINNTTIAGVVTAPCSGYPTPSWQTGVVGLPGNGVRGVPDVAMFAANGPWNHAYVLCYSGPVPAGQQQKSCNGSAAGFSYGGGTSYAAPIMAGIQALVNAHAGGLQGNPNYRYYQLAAQQYGANGSTTCNASNGNAVGTSCIFHDITLGDNAVACSYYPSATAPNPTLYNCYGPPTSPSGTNTNGVLFTLNSSNMPAPAFQATTGWDYATGIGSVNVYNLVKNW